MTAQTDHPEVSPGRRRFLRRLSQGFLSIWGFGFLWVVGSFMKPPRSRRSLTERILKVGSLDSLPVGAAQLVRHGREPIWVVRIDEENLVGLAGVCTHMHCVLGWQEHDRSLVCPCHDGAFDLNGNVLKGPAPRPLKRFDVETRLGDVYLHL